MAHSKRYSVTASIYGPFRASVTDVTVEIEFLIIGVSITRSLTHFLKK